MLNNWPLGFYHPATLVKDAQRHGLHVLPIDVTRSDWNCTLERRETRLSSSRFQIPTSKGADSSPADAGKTEGGLGSWNLESGTELRLGLRYVSGLREATGRRIEAARAAAPFRSLDDVAVRAALRDDEMQALAYIGAFAAFGLTRREALWQAAAKRDRLWAAALSRVANSRFQIPSGQGRTPEAGLGIWNLESGTGHPPGVLPEMSMVERTLADYRGSGVTVGPQLMRYLRAGLTAAGVVCARDLPGWRDGSWVKVAGLVIVRQRPGTAKGFCFLTLEDETGICNAVVVPAQFEKQRALIHTAALLQVEGPLQIVDGVIHVRARRFHALELPDGAVAQKGRGYRLRVAPADERKKLPKSHDFR